MRKSMHFGLLAVGMLLGAWSIVTSCAAPLDSATANASVNKLLGKWARTSDDCAHPELTFAEKTAAIYLEADGAPTAFKYPKVTYVAAGDEVTVNLNARHPYGKAPQKQALQFIFKDNDHVLLQLLKQKSFDFVRCVVAAGK